MKIEIRNLIIIAISTISLLSCALSPTAKELYDDRYKQINTIPMYGAPYKTKTDIQKKADKSFIEAVVKEFGSRSEAAKRYSALGWLEKSKGKNITAIKRFNQSWLLDPDYYQSYWGFGAISLSENKPEKASEFFEKALGLINDEEQKPRLLVDTAKSYVLIADSEKNNSPNRKKELYEKANKIIDQALEYNYGNAYNIGSLISYREGNYKRAWEIIKRARKENAFKFDPRFIEQLSEKMKEPEHG